MKISSGIPGVLILLAVLRSTPSPAQTPVSVQPVAEPVEAVAVDETPAAFAPLNLPTVSAGKVKFGTFYSLQITNFPPLPYDPFPDQLLYALGGNIFLYDDRAVDYAALQIQAEMEATIGKGGSIAAGGGGRMAMSQVNNNLAWSTPAYLTNLVTALPGGGTTVSFGIAGGTNFVPYDILMTTNLVSPASSWTWLGLGYTSNSYTFSNQSSDQAFYILAKPAKTMAVAWGDNSYHECDVPFGISNAVAVAGGIEQSLALLNNGTVVAWGDDPYVNSRMPTNLTGVTAIAAGWNHSVALLTNGTVLAWGTSVFGETNVPAGLTNVTVISAQALHSLALHSDGTVVAWGYNTSSGETNIPSGLSNVVAIAAGGQHNLAAKADGTVVAWGDNSYGQTNVPAGLGNVWDVAAGWMHSLALKRDGTVAAWGDNTYGETNVPAGLTDVVAIAAGGSSTHDSDYSLALKNDGTVVAWGHGQVLNPVNGLTGVFAIGGGINFGMAVRSGPRAPVITLVPVNQYQLAGGAVTFTSQGAGLYGVTYQWKTNGVNMAGATNATLTLTNVQAAQTNILYTVTVSNEVGSITSPNAHLYLVTAPVIISQSPLPTNQVAIYQSNLTLNVVATAPGQSNGFPLNYQWQFNGANIAGANAASYAFSVNANSGGKYSVIVTNAAGGTNANWQVMVYYPGSLLITQQPTNRYQIAGGNVTFAGGAVSSNAVTYQWSFNGTNIAGATNASVTLTNVQAAQQGYYNFIVGDGVGHLTSSNANFYLVTPPAITSQTLPTNPVVYFQGNLTLSVTATAPGQTNGFPVVYQWRLNGTNITGANTVSYNFTADDAGSAGTYSIIVTNAAGSTNRTWQVTLNYGTLAYHLATNAVAHASGYTGSSTDQMEVANWTYASYTNGDMALLTNAVWSTNFWLKGVRGLSATPIGISNGVGTLTGGFGGQTLLTMVSPRHYLHAHHVGDPIGMIAFLDTNNVIYWRTSTQLVEIGTSDTDVGILNADLPASVGCLAVLPTNWSNYLPTNGASVVQGIGMNQDMKVFSQPMTFGGAQSLSAVSWFSSYIIPFGLGTNWNVVIRPGDSSDPERFLVGNQLVLVSHNFQVNDGPNYAFQVNEINQQMHYLSTNNNVGTDYQLSLFSLTNWPNIH